VPRHGRRPFLLAVAAALVLFGCSKEAEEALYRLVPVTQRDIVVSASAAGTIEPVQTIEVKSKASGEIVEVRVEEGDRVEAGDLLVKVDPRIPKNAVDQAEADSVVARARLENAESQLERAKSLYQTQAITQTEYEAAVLARATAYAELVSARRALEDAQIAYEDTEVRAPTAGVILGRSVEPGMVIASASRDVSGGSVLLRMARLDTVQIRAYVDETDIGRVEPGLPVTIVVDAFPNREFNGTVLRIGAEAVVEQNVTIFPVLIHIDNRARLLRPGMNAEVVIHIGEEDDAVAVPNAALLTEENVGPAAAFLGLSHEEVQSELAMQSSASEPAIDSLSDRAPRNGRTAISAAARTGAEEPVRGEYVVFALRDGVPAAVPIRTGLTDFSYVSVISGLDVGDTVLVLPTVGLLQSREEWQERARRRAGGPLPASGN